MSERIAGLYYPDNTFKTADQIKSEAFFRQDSSIPRKITPLPVSGDFDYWSGRFIDRQITYNENEGRSQHVEIEFPSDIVVNLIGDIHAGSPNTDYSRIEQEAYAIAARPNSYVLALGDWVDGFFFNPAQFEQIEQAPEQFEYQKSLLKFFSSRNRLLVAWGGDHDKWASKSGANPYASFSDETGAYYMHGVGYVTLYVGGQEYKLSAAHRHNGFSIYNKTHAAMRLYRDGAEGADICVTAHTHQKGYIRQAVKEYGGKARNVDFISVGPYKSSDEYARKKGFPDQHPNEMFGSAIALNASRKHIVYYDDILEANR